MEIGYTGALVGGVLSLLSPCSVLLLPAFFAYAFTSPASLLGRTALFYLGLVVTLVPMGLLAGIVGSFVIENRVVVVSIAAALVIAVGFAQIIGVTLPSLSRGAATEGTSALSVFVLGTVYAIAGVCTGPILGSVLTIAALGGSPVYGALLLALYALGMTVPLFVLAAVWKRLRLSERRWMRPRELRLGTWRNTWWMIASGVLSIGIGILLIVTGGTAELPSILTIDQQYAAETWVIDSSSTIPNLLFGVVALVLLLGVVALYRFRTRVRSTRSARTGWIDKLG